MSKLTITTEQRKVSGPSANQYSLVRLAGFVDAPNYMQFETSLEKLVRLGKPYMVLDFHDVEYINSTGISAVIRFHGQLAERGGALILVQVSRNVGLTMHLLGVTNLVPFLKTLKESEDYIEGKLRDGLAGTGMVPGDGRAEATAAKGTAKASAKSDGAKSAVAFVERPQKVSGSVVVAVPREGPFTKIFRSRIQRSDGRYQLFHSLIDLKAQIDNVDPDLIVIDARLPAASEFVEYLKSDTRHSLASVLMLYGKDSSDLNHIRGFKVWENDYLQDPFDLMNLFMLAESELRRVPRDRRLFAQQVKFQFDSSRPAVERGLKLADRLIRKLQLGDTETTALFAALKEGIDNAVLHGNKHDMARTVTVNYVVDPKKATFLIEDEGTGFDYEFYMSKMDSQEAFERAKQRIRDGGRGGLGILLMYKCTDRLEYSNEGRVLRIEKNLKG
ncbi:MAG: ATP-binding protein [Planctomycetota bacterium]